MLILVPEEVLLNFHCDPPAMALSKYVAVAEIGRGGGERVTNVFLDFVEQCKLPYGY